jgi:hypothetical protein
MGMLGTMVVARFRLRLGDGMGMGMAVDMGEQGEQMPASSVRRIPRYGL